MADLLHGRKSDSDFLLDLAKRLRKIPASYGVDGFDIDCVAELSSRLRLPSPQSRAPLTAGAAAKLSVFLEALSEWGCISNDERAVEILKFQQSGYDLSAYEEGR